MTIATDMGATPLVGGLARFVPGPLLFPQAPGLSASLLGPWFKPVSSDFTLLVNTPTLTDCVDRMKISCVSNSANLVVALKPDIPPTPYTLDLCGTMLGIPGAALAVHLGLGLTDGTKYRTFEVGASTARFIFIQSWTNSTTFLSSVLAQGLVLSTGLFWLRICDDGTTRSFRMSSNGKDYLIATTEATNTFVTPTQWGISMFDAGGAAALPVLGSIYHLQASPGILGDAP